MTSTCSLDTFHPLLFFFPFFFLFVRDQTEKHRLTYHIPGGPLGCMELPPYNEFVALEIPFPYTPLLSQNQTDTHITISLLSLFSASRLSTHIGTPAHCNI
jgi:hypothetical protein